MDRKYIIQEYKLGELLDDFRCGKIAIPAIQRSFVWTPRQVKEFVESLYNGYPIGQFVLWRHPDVALKDGTKSGTRKLLIDGQQRLTALRTALFGEVLDAGQRRIRIAFNPERQGFALVGRSCRRGWISDISLFFRDDGETSLEELAFYTGLDIELAKQHILPMLELPVSVVELNRELDLREVSEIFLRTNSTGKGLQKAEAAKTTMGTEERDSLRLQSFVEEIATWKTEVYAPSFRDILCVANIVEFGRVKLDSLVEKCSYGQNTLAVDLLRSGLRELIRKEDFLAFVAILRSAGFVSKCLISSVKTVNFVFALFLLLKKHMPNEKARSSVIRKWFVFCLLSCRYSTGFSDKRMERDLRALRSFSLQSWIYDLRESEVTREFWTGSLVHTLRTCSPRHAVFLTFLASQVYEQNKSFLNTNLSVESLLQRKGVIRTIFPKSGLSKNNLPDVAANYTLLDPGIGRDKDREEPKIYLGRVLGQCDKGIRFPGGGSITDERDLLKNLKENEIPESILFMETSERSYRSFIEERSERIAQRLERYFHLL